MDWHKVVENGLIYRENFPKTVGYVRKQQSSFYTTGGSTGLEKNNTKYCFRLRLKKGKETKM